MTDIMSEMPNELQGNADTSNTDLIRNFGDDHYELIYGLKKPRDGFLDVLKTRYPDKKYFTADDFNNRLLAQVTRDGSTFSPRLAANNSLTPVSNGYLARVTNVPNEIAINNNDPTSSPKPRSWTQWHTKITRCCQAGFMAANRVHFILDDIDLTKVFCPTPHEDDLSKQYYFKITSYELRFIYDNWEALSDKVTFYRNGQVAECLPWEEEAVKKLLPSTTENDSNSTPTYGVSFSRVEKEAILPAPTTPTEPAVTRKANFLSPFAEATNQKDAGKNHSPLVFVDIRANGKESPLVTRQKRKADNESLSSARPLKGRPTHRPQVQPLAQPKQFSFLAPLAERTNRSDENTLNEVREIQQQSQRGGSFNQGTRRLLSFKR